MSKPTGPIVTTASPCTGCGVDNPSVARFCMACGAGIGPPVTPASGLRFVSVIFCDVVGSTGLATSLEPDRWAAVLDGYFSLVGSLVEQYGGKVEKFIGDAVVAVFGVEGHGESAAAAAVSAATAIGHRTGEYARGLGELLLGDFPVRSAVASGHVAVSGRTSSFVIGSVLNRAARLQQYAPDDGVIVDLATRLQLQDHFPLRAIEPVTAKGFAQSVPAWIVGPAGAPAPGTGTVGRTGLVGELAARIGTAAAATGPTLILVGGPSGVGKSRLVAEVLDHCTGLATAVLRCPPAGTGLGLLACFLFLEEIENAARQGRDRVDVTVQLTGASTRAEQAPAQDRGELGRALTAALDRLRGPGPLLLVVEHSEWTPGALADLLDELTTTPGRPVVVLLVGVSAPEALADRGDHRLTVPPLGRADARRLAHRLLAAQHDTSAADHSPSRPTGTGVPGHDPAPPTAPAPTASLAPDSAADEIALRAGGIPRYIEQMVVLRRFAQPGDDWAPPSAHAALGARLDRLDTGSRDLLVLLAAAGRDLSLEDLGTLMAPDRVAVAAADLLEAGLVESADAHKGRLAPAFPVVAEVALRRLTRSETADVHARLARSLEPVAERRPAVAELLAGHWEAAHTALRGVEPGSDRTARAAESAVTAFGVAARFALSRGRPELVLTHTGRARALAEADRAQGADLDVLEAYALGSQGMPRAALERVERVLSDPGRAAPAARIHARLNSLYSRTYLTGDAPAVPDDPHYLAAVASPDPEARVGAHLYAGLQSLRAGDHPAAERALRSALRSADGAGTCLGLTEVYANLAMALVNGDTPVPAALADCERLHQEVAGSRLLGSATGVALALVRHMSGDRAAADSAMDEAEGGLRDLGQGTGAATIAGWRAVLAARSGDWGAAADWWTVQGDRCAALGMARQASLSGLQAELAREASGEGRSGGARGGSALDEVAVPPAEAWAEHTVALQALAVRALRADDPESAATHLDAVVRHLGTVRGSGAVITPLLCSAVLARRTGLPVAGRALTALRRAIKAKQDLGVRAP
ncbi:AAA family ATPase [Streptomyces sp. SID12501]|uniref:AAA family ATPase n=1 Tax=Streptomyces sp. SID12501 TaxID=2706042 RepID=A0A6B3C1E0_9ACTN|nr:AAA family ATPase [Streptomyces sp. SID12501]NEC90110.1 AAA family ATPase [Streptomyces sp. SID12501]